MIGLLYFVQGVLWVILIVGGVALAWLTLMHLTPITQPWHVPFT